MKTIWQMIKLKVINNRKLWICCLCIVAMALLCFLSPFPSDDPDVKETVLKVWLSTDREQLPVWEPSLRQVFCGLERTLSGKISGANL